MDKATHSVLRNIQMNLEGFRDLPRREQLEHKIEITLALIGALLKEDDSMDRLYPSSKP